MTEQSILDFIPTGEENAVHSAEICRHFDLTERERRKLFERLRNAGGGYMYVKSGLFQTS